MKIGDLVKMNRGYSETGLLLELINEVLHGPKPLQIPKPPPKWARILWSDHGLGIEKIRDLEVVR